MKIINWVVILLCLFECCDAQEINWSESSNWQLYNIHNKAGFNYSVDTLSHFKSIHLNDDSVHSFLEKAEIWPIEKYSMWMGLYIATCELDHKIRKIIISNYGGFLYDQTTKRYYQLPGHKTNNWLEWLNANAKKIL